MSITMDEILMLWHFEAEQDNNRVFSGVKNLFHVTEEQTSFVKCPRNNNAFNLPNGYYYLIAIEYRCVILFLSYHCLSQVGLILFLCWLVLERKEFVPYPTNWLTLCG